MATARTKKAATEEPKEQAEAPAPKAPQKTVIKVMNPHPRFFYIHPATGTRLASGDVKELPKDNWLEAQIAAGILKEV